MLRFDLAHLSTKFTLWKARYFFSFLFFSAGTNKEDYDFIYGYHVIRDHKYSLNICVYINIYIEHYFIHFQG